MKRVYHLTTTIYANKIRLQEEKKVYNILTASEILMNAISDNPDDVYFTYDMDKLSKIDGFDQDIIIYPDGSMAEMSDEINLLEVTRKVIKIMTELKYAMVTDKRDNELSQFIFNYNIDKVMNLFNIDDLFDSDYKPENVYNLIKEVLKRYKWLGSIYRIDIKSTGSSTHISDAEGFSNIRDILLQLQTSDIDKIAGKYEFYTTGGKILSFGDKGTLELKAIIPWEENSSEF